MEAREELIMGLILNFVEGKYVSGGYQGIAGVSEALGIEELQSVFSQALFYMDRLVTTLRENGVQKDTSVDALREAVQTRDWDLVQRTIDYLDQ